MGCTALFQYLIDSEKKLENRFDLPAGGLQFVFSSSFPLPKSKTFLDFMAFTGNFYDWIWFSRITTDLLTPLIPLIAFYINGVKMALFFSTLEHDSVSWIFRQFCSEKKGRIWKGEGGIVAADSFQIDWKKRGEIGKSTISIREKMPILWLFYFLMFQTL